MAVFVVTYLHSDLDGWNNYLAPHLDWIAQHLETNKLLASGPSTSDSGTNRTALLVVEAENRAVLDDFLATDPYAEHGQVNAMTVTEWDPIFGTLNAHSSRSGENAASTIASTLASFGK
ncbi:YciI family protein [Rhodococcus sp. Eu-32]|uniref:YciI family protein n=1 Tax=Rhodococcus sp. Eu-32 TaxID=1017319 RepID=UPI0014041261|nr:YciI family protein [Rhodococcus sp. Eu-32]